MGLDFIRRVHSIKINKTVFQGQEKSLYWHQKIHKLMYIYYIFSVEIKFKWSYESIFFMIPGFK